jgi:hypothetical protein
MSAQFRLNDHLVNWNKFLLEEWTPALVTEANTRADFEYKFNLFKTKLRINQPTIASAWAESMALANDEIAELNNQRRLAEGRVEALRKTLNWLEAKADAIRSEVSSEREESKLHAANRYVP